MRIARVLPLLLSIAVLWALDHSFGSLPPIGKILDPVNGAMAAAEPVNEDWNRALRLADLKAPVQVWLDTSLIAHIRAANDHDLYYAQGYIHATFRLWQMDLQTRAAGGRVSEVAGPKAIEFDRGMRREGMVWGAQHSLEAMEAEPRTKAMLDAYRDGINAYVHSLNYRRLPIEYKLMGFAPENWTNLRTALLMKYMARDLTGKTDDIAYTQLRDQLGQEQFDFLFPERIKGSKPVIPEGTKFDAPSLRPPPTPGDSVWAHFDTKGLARYQKGQPMSKKGPVLNEKGRALSKKGPALNGVGQALGKNRMALNDKGLALFHQKEALSDKGLALFDKRNTQDGNPDGESGIGSNNWAISGSHTASGKPILCNDPHLALNLPSLWFEMQLTAPGINAYGASLPGAPGIVIGFNEKISWGFTNNYRDVKDFYEIEKASPCCEPLPPPPALIYPPAIFPKEDNSQYLYTLAKFGNSIPLSPEIESYHFNGGSIPFESSIEVIKVKGGKDVIDTVLYTIHGPVTYDPSFPPPDVGTRGVPLLACTWMGHRGSNEILATYLLNRAGDYPAFTDAISHFECPAQNIAYADGAGNIAMWGQGRFINKWKGQGKYVMEGHDSATLWGDAIPWQENPHVLNPPQGYVASANQQVADSSYPYWYNGSFVEWRAWEIDAALKRRAANMISVQTSVTSLLLEDLVLLNYHWPSWCPTLVDSSDFGDYFADLKPKSKAATNAQIWWSQLYKDIWQDDFPNASRWPSSEVTVQLLLSDSSSKYYDDKRTQQVETLRDIVQRAFRETTDSLDKLKHTTGLEWYKVKNTSLTHLAKIPAFSYPQLKIGGWSNTINACTHDHGPSWRMIVEMDSIPKAYAIYPGGQSGNPGSRHYGDFIDQWVKGKYHAIQFITAAITKNPFTYTWTLAP